MKSLQIPRRLLVCLALITACATNLRAEIVPLIHAHAHNDYEHKRPLLDALDHGFCSVEADVHLVDGRLLVAHDRSKVKPERTLQALYLDPLRERVKRNDGHVYPAGPEFTLLVELKSDWQTSYPVLREILKQYAGMLTTFGPGPRKLTPSGSSSPATAQRKCSPANPSAMPLWTATWPTSTPFCPRTLSPGSAAIGRRTSNGAESALCPRRTSSSSGKS